MVVDFNHEGIKQLEEIERWWKVWYGNNFHCLESYRRLASTEQNQEKQSIDIFFSFISVLAFHQKI